ncbi:hypothetical protein PBY51_019027 [Eleginops maclovinus]|uniref:Uncharacterized protein n=1 Tax=Eleginops maclovinus TaxID=56733 RepID=A0AAN7Y9A9_ELEMC|nr:hypothetical protein PBY51_019027 [Eleginops maclovinus]
MQSLRTAARLTGAHADKANRRVHLASSCSRCFNNGSTFLPLTSVSHSIPFSLHLPTCSSFLIPSPHLVYHRYASDRSSTSLPLPWKQWDNSRLAAWLLLLLLMVVVVVVVVVGGLLLSSHGGL